jgi:hypothetical protein
MCFSPEAFRWDPKRRLRWGRWLSHHWTGNFVSMTLPSSATWTTSACSYYELEAAAQVQLRLNHQRLNEEKCGFLAFDDSGGLFEEVSAGLGEASASWSPEAARELAKAAADHVWQGVSRLLGQMGYQGDPSAIEILLNFPWIIYRFPKQSSQYLRQVRSRIRRWDPFLALVTAPASEESAAAQLRILRLLDRKQIGAETGRDFFERGRTLDRRDFAPLANEYFAAAGRAQGKLRERQGRAVEHAVEFADLSARRALLAPFCDEAPARVARSALDRLELLEPDLAATMALVRAA